MNIGAVLCGLTDWPLKRRVGISFVRSNALSDVFWESGVLHRDAEPHLCPAQDIRLEGKWLRLVPAAAEPCRVVSA